MKKQASPDLFVPEPTKVILSKLNFAVYNPRRITKEEMAELKQSLLSHGAVLNLVVQLEADDGTPLVLIGGHQRVRAIRELAKEGRARVPEHVWAVVLDIKDEEAKKLNIALNNIEASFDDFMLGQVLASIRTGLTDADVAGMGFTMPAVDNLIAITLDPSDQADGLEGGLGDLSPLPQVPTLSISFETADDRDAAKAVLKRLAASGVAPGKATMKALEAYEKEGAPGSKRRRRAAAS